jgi:hypothetical protein
MTTNNLGERISAAKSRVSIASAWARLGLPNPPPEGSRLVRSPIREERTPSFSIFQGGKRWKDHSGDAGGDVFDFVELVVKEGRPAAIQRVLEWAGDTASLSGHGTASSPPPEPPTSPGRAGSSFNADRHAILQAKRRTMWPTFSYPSQADIQRIAYIRQLDPAAVEAVALAGLLRTCRHESGHDVFVLTEGAFAQARRLDGELFQGGHKTQNLRASEGAFVGACLLGTDPQPVLLIEGCVGLLEAAALIGVAQDGWAWTALAAVSSSSRFATQPDLLTALAGRLVRVIPDTNEAGARAAESWCQALHQAGASVDVFDLPAGHRDLGQAAQNPADHAELIHRLFTI